MDSRCAGGVAETIITGDELRARLLRLLGLRVAVLLYVRDVCSDYSYEYFSYEYSYKIWKSRNVLNTK